MAAGTLFFNVQKGENIWKYRLHFGWSYDTYELWRYMVLTSSHEMRSLQYLHGSNLSHHGFSLKYLTLTTHIRLQCTNITQFNTVKPEITAIRDRPQTRAPFSSNIALHFYTFIPLSKDHLSYKTTLGFCEVVSFHKFHCILLWVWKCFNFCCVEMVKSFICL